MTQEKRRLIDQIMLVFNTLPAHEQRRIYCKFEERLRAKRTRITGAKR